MACDRLSAEMATEEVDDNAEVKEDHDVETDVVEGGGFTTRRRSRTVRIQRSRDAVEHIARHVWRQTFEETDRKTKKNLAKSTRTETKTAPREEKRRRKAKKMAKRTQHEGKLNAPMNHMIDVTVASYWECACQRPLTSGSLGALSC